MNKKLISVAIGIATIASFVGPTAFAQSNSDLQAQIAALLAQIQSLQGQLGSGGTPSTYSFTRDLTVGSKGADVLALQQFLNGHGALVAGSGAGSPGLETTYFGGLTKAALAQWQGSNGILPSVGYFGPKTRAFLASMSVGPVPPPVNPPVNPPVGGGTPPVVPAGTGLAVSLAADSPKAQTVGTGTAFNPMLKLALTAGSADVSVTALRIKKGGFLANTNINGIDLVDSTGARHGNVISSISADSDALLTFSSAPVLVKAGQTETVLVRANLLAGVYSGTVYFSVETVSAFTANTSLISGSFPFVGGMMNVVDGTNSIATVTVEARAVNASGANFNVDAANEQEIAKFRITQANSKEAIKLYSLRLYNTGNASDSDFKDVQLVDQIGNVLATAQPSNKYVTFDLSATPYLIDKGLNKDFTIRAKIVNGASRTIQFAIYDNYDVAVRGVDTGAYILATATGNSETSFPVEGGTAAYNRATINSGSLIFNKDASSASAAVTPGTSNAVLATFSAKANGEDMEVRKVSFYIATTTGSTALTGTVYVRFNGAVVYSVAASSLSTGSATEVTLTSYPTLVSGVAQLITVEASISSNATAADSYTVKDFDITSVKRVITNDIVDPGVGIASGNAIAVKSASMTVTTLSTPVANSVVAGTSQFELARFELNAQAGGEDIRVSKVIVKDTLTGGNTSYAGVSNLQLYLAGQPLSTTASTVTNANFVTFTFVNPIDVLRTPVTTLSLRGDILTVASSTEHTFNIASTTSDITATGKTTGNTLAANQMSASGAGQKMTVAAAGTMTLTNVSGAGGSPSVTQLANIGSLNQTVFAFNLTSQYEAQKISALKLTWTGSPTSTLITNDVKNIRLYKNAETLAFATAAQGTCSAGVCTYTFTWADNWGAGSVTPGTQLKVVVMADIGGQGEAKLGDNFVFSIASSTADITAKGAVSGTSASSVTGTPTVTGRTYIVPFNVAVTGETPTAGSSLSQTISAGTTIGRFKVANNGSAPVSLTGVTFTDNGTNSTTTETYTLYASDENQSNYTATSTTSTVNSVNFGTAVKFGGADLTLNGGSYRYLTVQLTTAGGIVTGDSFNLAVAALGDLKFSVTDANLGYDGDADGNPAAGTSSGLFVSGTPALGTLVKL